MIGIRPQFGPLFRAGNHFDIGVLGAPQQVSLAGQHLIGLRCMRRVYPPGPLEITAYVFGSDTILDPLKRRISLRTNGLRPVRAGA